MSQATGSEARETRRKLLHRLDRQRTLVAAGYVGALSGAVAVGFRLLVEHSEGLGRSTAAALTHLGPLGYVVLMALGATLGALAGLLTDRIAPDAGGSGIPQTKAAIMGMRGLRPWRLVLVKIVGGCAALTAGMSLGREGPTIHLGAAMGELFGRLGRVPARSKRVLVAAGGGAGLAAAFNAPLAGFLFVMEELRREMSPLTYGTSLISSVLAVGVARFALGGASSFALESAPQLPLSNLPAVLLVGIAAGFVGVAFNRALLATSGFRIRRTIPRWIAGATVGAFTALLLVAWPEVTGGGHAVAQRVLQGGMVAPTVAAVAALFVGKFVTTVLSYATGVPGGLFAPLLVIGSLVGLCVGLMLQPNPLLAVSPPLLATVGMAAVLASSVRAPLTGVVLIMEMSGQYSLLYDLLVAAFAAYTVAELLRDTPIYEALLERDLHGGALRSEHEGEVVEAFVETGSRLDGARIGSLRLPDNVTIASIEREGRTLAPRGGTTVRPGDHLTFVVGAEGPAENALVLIDATRAP
ncbi:H(+)/Cl(-) exchange transporter ClcA [bacterium]|nr:MAG: H(+)/Cl(-) exchange transporter ClcA [bacterium]